MPAELAARLDELARVRFGGSVSRALVAAVEAVVVIYDVPETYRAGDGAEALRAYVESVGGAKYRSAKR